MTALAGPLSAAVAAEAVHDLAAHDDRIRADERARIVALLGRLRDEWSRLPEGVVIDVSEEVLAPFDAALAEVARQIEGAAK